MKRLLTIFLALIFSLTMVGAFGCISLNPNTGNPNPPDNPPGPQEPVDPGESGVWLKVSYAGESTDHYRPVFDVFDMIKLEVKTSNTPGWYLEYVVHDPHQAVIDAGQNITFYAGSTLLATIIYTNGVESITKTINTYQAAWNEPMDLYLTSDDVSNGYRAVNSYKFRLSTGKVLELAPICVVESKPFYDAEIEEIIIEDESIVHYDPITRTLVPLKAGETKVVIEGRWRTYTSSSYEGLSTMVGREGLTGSLGLKRELTITVYD